MKLLIITQKVDRNDPILGFFHRWIEEFAKHCEKVTVVCLSEGEHNLPKNVKVLSLGKERGVSRLGYMLNFYHLIWRERKNYNTIFVHMNQEYILLGGLLWKLLGKKVTMWRNHYAGSLLTRIAMALSDKIFCTSKYSFTARSKKTILMPVGIDTERFLPSEEKCSPNSILSIGRISPSKNLELVVTALGNLKKTILVSRPTYTAMSRKKMPHILNNLKTLLSCLMLAMTSLFTPGFRIWEPLRYTEAMKFL